jgi:hypothetical protein
MFLSRGDTMFSKISRYKKLATIVTTDASGRLAESKCIRLLPEVSGTFTHTIEEADRLDHLAFKYYEQPRKWWHICDANPGFLSPLALLGKEPVATTLFPVTLKDTIDKPPWADLQKELYRTPGVRDVAITEEVKIVDHTIEPSDEYNGGDAVEVKVKTETFKRVVKVIYNRLNIKLMDIKEIIEAAGFKVGEPSDIGRLGKTGIIPPNIMG